MSIAVLIGVHDGVVLAADSAATLSMPPPPGVVLPQNFTSIVGNVYENANKIFNIVKGLPIGCITFGSGNIGNASTGTIIKDLRKKLTVSPQDFDFNPEQYTMEKVAGIMATFLQGECQTLQGAVKSNTNAGFLLGGYSKPGSLGESWMVEITNGVVGLPRQLRNPELAGINWGGQTEVLHRILFGYSPQLFDVLGKVTQPPQSGSQIAANMRQILDLRLQAPMVFAPMPIQDAIDLARFLVHAAIMFSRFVPGPNSVGGPIEIAVITKHEHFKWISRKHYYEQRVNREPIHVIVDK